MAISCVRHRHVPLGWAVFFLLTCTEIASRFIGMEKATPICARSNITHVPAHGLCLLSLLIVVAAPANSVIKTAACAVPSPFRPPFVDLRKYVDIDGGSGVARSELPTFAILLARGLSSPSIHP
jgi:hypothetical protein